jgi:hypothetical protein
MKSRSARFNSSAIRSRMGPRWNAALPVRRSALTPSMRPLGASIAARPGLAPTGQGRAVQRHAGAGEDLRLPVERQAIGVFRDQDMGDQRLGRQPALDQARGGLRLSHRALAAAAGVAGTDGDDHAQLGGNDVEPLGPVFAEPPRVYRRVICSTTRRPYRLCSGLHRTPPLLVRVGRSR